jgi:chaperonin GroES
MNKGNTLLYVVIGLLLLGLIGGGAFLLGRRTSSSTTSSQSSIVTSVSPATTQQIDSVSPTTSQQTKSNLFEGKVTKLSSDLQLFKVTENDVANGTADYFVYFSAGTYTRGEFAGYTRIIAIRPAEGPGPSMQYVLATKDYKSYLLVDTGKEKPQMGEIVALGEGFASDDGRENKMVVKVGQKVMYKKWGGNEVKVGGVDMLLVEQKDIMAIVE